MLTLTDKQNKGLKLTIERYHNNERYTCIAGYAGTGKSTLVQYIINEMNLKPWEVAYCCYTGKAALVLSQKGCPATTAHRLCYKSRELPNGTYVHTPRLHPENEDLKVVVVDEVSMLEREMWEILMSWNIYIIALGDPEQLPPLHESNYILDYPHVFLDEIMRQAKESEIIRLSMDVREGKSISYINNDEVKILPKSQLDSSALLNVDQVICGKNLTRFNLNKFMRESLWGHKYKDTPLNKDKIICLKNYCEFNLVNGEIGHIVRPKPIKDKFLNYDVVVGGFDTGYSRYTDLKMDQNLFLTGECGITDKIRRNFEKCDRPLEFDYGYAITCHKSQGSQWDSILVYDEWLGNKEMHRRWLYTAVTRAVKNLILFK